MPVLRVHSPPSEGSENDSPARLEQFDRISGRIVDYNLRTTRAGYDFIRTKGYSSSSQPLDLGLEISHLEMNAIPATRHLTPTIGERSFA